MLYYLHTNIPVWQRPYGTAADLARWRVGRTEPFPKKTDAGWEDPRPRCRACGDAGKTAADVGSGIDGWVACGCLKRST